MSLPKCWIGKFYTAWKCPHTSLVHTTNLKAYIARLITPFSYKLYVGLVVKFITKKYTSSDINFRLPSGKSLYKLLGWPHPAT